VNRSTAQPNNNSTSSGNKTGAIIGAVVGGICKSIL
jgi:hypothetical protein